MVAVAACGVECRLAAQGLGTRRFHVKTVVAVVLVHPSLVAFNESA